MARLLISDDNEHHTHGDVLQELFRSAQAPHCTTVRRPRENRALASRKIFCHRTVISETTLPWAHAQAPVPVPTFVPRPAETARVAAVRGAKLDAQSYPAWHSQ